MTTYFANKYVLSSISRQALVGTGVVIMQVASERTNVASELVKFSKSWGAAKAKEYELGSTVFPTMCKIFIKSIKNCQAAVAHTFNPSTQEAEGGGSL